MKHRGRPLTPYVVREFQMSGIYYPSPDQLLKNNYGFDVEWSKRNFLSLLPERTRAVVECKVRTRKSLVFGIPRLEYEIEGKAVEESKWDNDWGVMFGNPP